MPLVEVLTNLAASKMPKDFASKVASVIAATFGKPIERVSVAVMPGLQMFRGDDSPVATVYITSFGVFSADKNNSYAKPLTDVISKELDIQSTRTVLVFRESSPDYICSGGKTMTENLKKN